MPTDAGQSTQRDKETEIPDDEARDRLEYLADILLDLQSLTGASGGPTLKGLLALAHTEASLQAKRVDKLKDEIG